MLEKTLTANTCKAHDAYVIARNKTYTAIIRDTGAASGWILDNRGGFPKSTAEDGYNVLNDVSDKAGTALIRPINHITEGVITVETSLVTGGNGVSIEFRDNNDCITYKIKLINNSWCIQSADDSFDVILENAFSLKSDQFFFRITVDLDNKLSYTFINDTFCGSHALLADSVENFRFATDEESKIAVSPGTFLMYANYRIYDDFEKFSPLSVYGWDCGKGVSRQFNEMWIDSDKAKKSFISIDDKVAFQCHFKNKFAEKTIISLNCGDKALISVKYENNTLYACGKELYKTRFDDMWHRLKVAADTNTGIADILLNGRSVGKVEFEKGQSFDNVVFESIGGMSNFDHIKLYNEIDHEDYVPAPLSKANLDDYIVGMNICSMWVNGNHFGWGCITPFKEHQPYLGYYDEGNPETADWEIKYMVEHGVDFQAFCWYGGFENGYLKNPGLCDQLHEGYQYAKYSDKMYYIIMWEAAGKVMSMEQFKNVTIPYWFENYFLDDRYLKIDNKIVFYVYSPGSLLSNNIFGSVENTKAAFEYMEEVARSYGFDGIIAVESMGYNLHTEEAFPAKKMGFDGSVAYHWFGNGYLPEHNISNNICGEEAKATHFIPTISSGYDSYVWLKKVEDPVRRPVAVEEDFYNVCKWVRDDYLPKYKSNNDGWTHKMVLFSTWNEYGEGTFIMPCGVNGFGQLNAINRVFTNGGSKEDIIPTPSQRRRINHLYPQDLTILRRYGYYVKDQVVYDAQRSIQCVYSPAEKQPDGSVYYRATQGRNNIRNSSQLEIVLKGEIGTKVKISFTTPEEFEFSDTKSFTVTIDSEKEKTYYVNTRENYRFGECFKRTREGLWYFFSIVRLKAEAIDCTPSQASSLVMGDITVRSFVGNGEVAKDYHLEINGIEQKSDIYPEKFNDKIYFPFDPDTGIDFVINSLISYDRYSETLKISTLDHTVTFKRGESVYILDGKEKELGHKLWFTDGIPMLDFEKLSDDLGFKYEFEGNTLKIECPKSCDVDMSMLSDHDFVFSNNLIHGWYCGEMAIIAGEHHMTAKTTVATNNPQMYRQGTCFKASDYNKLKLRIRYCYDSTEAQSLVVFFTTDKKQRFHGERMIKVPLEVVDTGEQWRDYEVDLTKVDNWQDTITGLRIDPFFCTGKIEFEYMRFVKE